MRTSEMDDSPAASIAFWLASEIMPASATTVTSGSWRAVMNAPIRQRRPSLGRVALESVDHQLGPGLVDEQADGDLQPGRRSLEDPPSENPSRRRSRNAAWTPVKDQVARAQPGTSGARGGELLAPGVCANTGSGRLRARQEGAATPASASTRRLPGLLTGSMIRASTSWWDISSPPPAWPDPSSS
jgi:hypothetical protein